MTIRTTILGGTDFQNDVPGDADADDVNSTFNMLTYLDKFNGTTTKNSQLYLPYNQSSGTVTLNTGVIHRFSSFTLSAGTLTTDVASTSKSPLMIVVYGDVTLSGGTIDLSGKGLSGGAGGNGASFTDGTVGTGSDIDYYSTLVATGGTGGTGNGAGTTAIGFTDFAASELPTAGVSTLMNVLVGSGGGGGEAGSDSYGAGGAGGAGGGSIIIVCFGDINVNGVTINTSGANGSTGGNAPSGGGGGGGGGGAAGNILLAYTGSYTSGATHTNSGGSGGAGGNGNTSGTGGSGGAGASGTATDGSDGSASVSLNGAAGGAGGTGTLYTLNIT